MRFRQPMLAKDYEPDRVTYPCYVQPKLDGVRCVTNGQTFWSRNGKVFPRQNFKHLQVKPFPFLLDGELSISGVQDITHSEVQDFEDIVSVVKRADHELARTLTFNAFDVMTDQPYAARKKQLKQIFASHNLRVLSQRWVRVPTYKINSQKELEDHYDQFVDFGYEGLMVRSAFGLYVPSRTLDLLKYKPLKEEEFIILGVKEAKGKDAGTPVFICKSKGGEFSARPEGSMEYRRRLWRNRKRLVGKRLTVKFQDYTKYGKPRFPRAKVLRDYE